MAGANTRKVAGSGRGGHGRGPRGPRGARVSATRTGGALPQRLLARKQPRQERARETVEAILRAATHAFATHGYARTTTNLVAARAGVSVGSLYQYFPHKDALFAALHQRHTARVAAVVGGALARMADPATPLAQSLRDLLDAMHVLHDADPELTRAVSEQAPLVPRLELTLREHEAASVAAVEAILRARPEVRPGDRRVMARVLTEATESMTRWLAHDLPAGLERGAATDEVARLLAGYLAR